MTIAETDLILPDVDPEILAGEAEDFHTIVADITSGVADTISWRDVALGTYQGELLWAKSFSRKDKTGAAISPDFGFKIRFGDNFTTTVFMPMSHKNPNARRMRMQELMQTLARLCGPEFKNVPAPDPGEKYGVKEKCAYCDALGRVAVQKSPKVQARWADNSFVDTSTNEKVDMKKVVITRAA